jgi:protein tyrosine phosphatase (PTP) superfamily phosphohydrolase (DUF442 family)
MPQGPTGLTDPGWRPVPEAGTPPLPTEQPRAGVKLYAPQTEEPPALPIAPAAPKEQALTPAPRPVDIPQFAVALPNVGSGLQPFPDGVAWLQEKGYRTVLHLRQPGEDDAIARKVFEKRKLLFLSLEVSPRSLTPETVEAFNRIVSTEPNLPLYVYDKDGSLAGGMWYLYFRLAAKMPDDKARAEAERLGLRTDADGDYRTMWEAVQNYLANQPK